MNPISSTAFLTCGARADDAKSKKPICGDTYAGIFLNEHGRAVYDGFKKENGPVASFVARHRMMDDMLRAKIAENGDTTVIIIGAGFDTRAFRLDGGVWFEIDEPQVIDAKDHLLPVNQCKNSVQRISIEFALESLADKLPAVAPGIPVVVVMEGVFIYLSESQIHQIMSAIGFAFPGHTLICDMNKRHFMKKYGKTLGRRIEALGAKFKYLVDDPSLIFQTAGYRLVSTTSIIAKSLEYANAKLAHFIVATFMHKLVNGYNIYVFEAPVAADLETIAAATTCGTHHCANKKVA